MDIKNKTSKTIRELQAIARKRVHEAPELMAHGIRVFVPMPTRCAPDASGCNWSLQNCAPMPYKECVDRIVDDLRREFRVAD